MADSEDVVRLAALARIKVTPAEAESFALGNILEYVSVLEKLDANAQNEIELPIKNIFREDANPHEERLHTEAIIEQFPEREGDKLLVKQIISHD